jgi:hypothetical protein
VDRAKEPIFEKLKNYFAVPKNQGRFFIVFGLIALIFGGWQIVDTIRRPFKIDQARLLAQQQIQSSVEDQIKSLAELKAKDTDGDGLSDYDEIYIYGTSPYLEDTDSDGYSDKLEIETGNDPLCPAGQKCLVDSDTGVSSGQIGTNIQAPIDPYNISPAEIRQLLLSSGLDQATLNEIDDNSLRQMFLQAYVETETQVGKTTNQINSQPTDEVVISSPAQLRELLIANGVPAEQVNAVNDEELMQIYQEVISSVN